MIVNCKLARLFHNVTVMKEVGEEETKEMLEQQKIIVDGRNHLTLLMFE